MRNFMVLLPLAVTWNQLEAFNSDWILYKEAGKYLSMYPAGFLRRDLDLQVCTFWLPLSHRQGSGERRFVLFSLTFPFLLPTHFPVPLQHSSFSCCCESVLVGRVNTFEWKRRWVWEALSSSIPKGWAGFAFPAASALLRDVPKGVSVGWQRYPWGIPLTVRRQERGCAGLASCRAGFPPFYLSCGLWDRGLIAADGEFCSSFMIKSAWTWALGYLLIK